METAKDTQQFTDDPEGWAARWKMELGAAKKELEEWHKQAEKIIKRFLDKRGEFEKKEKRWTLYTSNIQTQMALLYGRTPEVDVERRFADANDHEGRIAGEILERILNADIPRATDGYSVALWNALQDRMMGGMGSVRVRYVAEQEDVEAVPAMLAPDGRELAPEIPAHQRKISEDVEVDYVYWRDMLWSPCRTRSELRWQAFRNEMTREALIERFGEEVGKAIPLNAKKADQVEDESKPANPWDRAEVWEIWHKDSKKVYWYVEGYGKVLDEQEDPYQLEGFFPLPPSMMANLTTSSYMPRPDFVLAQDLYDEVDTLTSRIHELIKCLRVVGLYDKTNEGLKRLLKEAADNEMVPIDNWAMFAEKGGVKGQIDWMPIDMIVATALQLREVRQETVQAIYQITGMSDIMRGQSSDVSVTATEQSIKARFASVRMQALQDEFATFASNIQRLKAEIISKHFSPETILARSNIALSFDGQEQQSIQNAIGLIKSKFSSYRIEVKPEAVSMTDFGALKAERTEVLAAVGGFFQAMAPLAQAMPGAMPGLFQILQWTLSGLKGSSSIEGVMDQMIAQAQKAAQQPQQAPPPDPKLQVAQLKAQADMQKIQADTQAHLIKAQADTQAEAAKEREQAEWGIREAQAKAQIKHRETIVQAALKPPTTGGFP